MAGEKKIESKDSKEKDLGGVESSLDSLKYELKFLNKVDELTKEKNSDPKGVDKFINTELNKQGVNAVNAINAIANNFEKVINSVSDKNGLVNNILDKSGVNAINKDVLVNNMLDKSGPNAINVIANNFEKVINSVSDKNGFVNKMLDRPGVNLINKDVLVNNMLDKSGPNVINVANVISNNWNIVNSISDETKKKLDSYVK